MGARGNSGAIMCEWLGGLTGVLGEGDEADGAEVARAMSAASDAARQAVLRPVEGTILTVASAAAEGATRAAEDSAPLVSVLQEARPAAREALARSPDVLPVLAPAGVVGPGGGGCARLPGAAR